MNSRLSVNNQYFLDVDLKYYFLRTKIFDKLFYLYPGPAYDYVFSESIYGTDKNIGDIFGIYTLKIGGYYFFDGHGYHNFSACYNEDSYLSEIDWNVIHSNNWSDKFDGGERKRKKQTELLVSSELSIDYLVGIGVYNFEAQQKIICKLKEKVLNLNCIIKQDWYYK